MGRHLMRVGREVQKKEKGPNVVYDTEEKAIKQSKIFEQNFMKINEIRAVYGLPPYLTLAEAMQMRRTEDAEFEVINEPKQVEASSKTTLKQLTNGNHQLPDMDTDSGQSKTDL